MIGQGLILIIRSVLAPLIIDVIAGVLQRVKEDPEFNAKIRAGFLALDNSKTIEDNHAAVKALQDLIAT